jgi:thiamine pyrophosphokinase
MKRAIIIANGEMEIAPAILKDLQPDDLIIATDGGTFHCQSQGIIPSVIIGDFDSVEAELVDSYEHMGVVTVRYPSHKDETDLELAVQYALQVGCELVYILGALGGRWDMTLANIMLLASSRFTGLKMCLMGGTQEISLLRGETQSEIRGKPGDRLSLIPVGGDCHGITTQGLEYPLNAESLHFGTSRGVSNVLIQEITRIELKEGTLLCIVDRLEN